MTKEKSIERIIGLMLAYSTKDRELAWYVAMKIYADVVAVAVDDERTVWVELAARAPEDFAS